jgi:thiol-disulfide isomerase/thioredoxin
MRRALALLIGLAAILALAGCSGAGGLGDGALQTVADPGDRRPAPELSVPSLRGTETVTLDGRDKPVILNFWASWCEPCKRETPALIEFHNLRPDVDVVGVAVNDRTADSIRFADKLAIPYQLGSDRSGDAAARFDVSGLPTTLVIDADGRVAAVFPGEIDREQLVAFADQIAG